MDRYKGLMHRIEALVLAGAVAFVVIAYIVSVVNE